MSKNQVLIGALKQIVDLEGEHMFYNSKKFIALLDDLAPEEVSARNVFHRTINDDILLLLYNVYCAKNDERIPNLMKCRHTLIDKYGLNEKWCDIILTVFSDAFEWEYVPCTPVILESDTINAEKETSTHIPEKSTDEKLDLPKNEKEIQLSDGGLYKGEALAGQPHGIGVCIYENGDSYTGHFAFGRFNGRGKYTYSNGAYYDGEYKDGMFNGTGVYCDAQGNICKGEFKDGNFYNCSGKYRYSDSLFTGTWVMGQRSGHGIIVWDDGGKWEGVFKNNSPFNGSGIWKYDDSWYEGSFLNGNRDGKGKITWNTGGSCEGEFSNGAFTGTGKWQYADCYFEGSFINGKREGKGKLVFDKGGVWEGEFKDDQQYDGRWNNGSVTIKGVSMTPEEHNEHTKSIIALVIAIAGLIIYIVLAFGGQSYLGAGIFGACLGISATLFGGWDSAGAIIMMPIVALLFNFILNLFI